MARCGTLLEAMLGHDRSWSMWRVRHALTVELRFYPELWEMRSRL